MPGQDAIIIGPVQLFPQDREVFVLARRLDLTDDDFELLRLLMEQRGRVVTRTALITVAWGDVQSSRIALLEHHIDVLRSAIAMTDVTIKTFPGIGYSID